MRALSKRIHTFWFSKTKETQFSASFKFFSSVGHASEAVCISFELKAAAFAKCNKVQ
jgi:hypothetical protein